MKDFFNEFNNDKNKKENKKENKLIPFTALWEKTDKKGNKMFAGSINGMSSVLMLKNYQKNKKTDPDYIVYITNSNK